MRLVKWGIIGAGKIAEKFISDFNYVSHGKIMAIASRDIFKSQLLAEKYGIPKFYGSYNEMLTDSSIDAVYIATPHSLHFEHTLLCFEHRKHVLCEKPVTVNAGQLRILIEEAQKRNVFFMEAMWTAFNPSIIQMQTWLAEKKLGKLHFIQAEFGFKANPDPEARLFNPHLAGGALLDIGIYPLTFALLAAQSEITDVQVQVQKSETGIDASNQIQLQFKNGVLAQLSSTFMFQMQNRGIIYGDNGRIEIPEFWKAKKAILSTPEGIENFTDESPSWGYCHEINHVNTLILQNKNESTIMPLSRSLKMIELMDSLRTLMGIRYPME